MPKSTEEIYNTQNKTLTEHSRNIICFYYIRYIIKQSLTLRLFVGSVSYVEACAGKFPRLTQVCCLHKDVSGQ